MGFWNEGFKPDNTTIGLNIHGEAEVKPALISLLKSSSRYAGANTIRQLMDRTIIFSNGGFEGFGDAYTSATGRLSSVDTTNTKALFDTNFYKFSPQKATSTSETHSPVGVGSTSMVVEQIIDTAVTGYFSEIDVYLANSGNWTLTIETYPAGVVLVTRPFLSSAGGNNTVPLSFTQNDYPLYYLPIGTYKIKVYGSHYIYEGNPASSYTGTLMSWVSQLGFSNGTSFTFVQTSTTNAGYIVQTIPSGTFSSTCSSAIGVPLIKDWETGDDIKFKLTNGTDDTGWLDCGTNPTVSDFTAFTSQPTTLIVKLIPKSTTPTLGYPSIYGFWTRAD